MWEIIKFFTHRFLSWRNSRFDQNYIYSIAYWCCHHIWLSSSRFHLFLLHCWATWLALLILDRSIWHFPSRMLYWLKTYGRDINLLQCICFHKDSPYTLLFREKWSLKLVLETKLLHVHAILVIFLFAAMYPYNHKKQERTKSVKTSQCMYTLQKNGNLFNTAVGSVIENTGNWSSFFENALKCHKIYCVLS